MRSGTENLRGVFHSFTGGPAELSKALSYGFMIGINGIVTFKNSNLAEVVRDIPQDRLLLETDAPFLAPVPYRGKRNESSYLIHIAAKVGEIFNLSKEEIGTITSNNASDLFQTKPIHMDHNGRSILIIYTGGTIGMLEDPVKGSLKPFDFTKIMQHIPEIKGYGYHIESISFDPPIDSSDIDSSTWTNIAEIIEKHYDEFDGFVVLHGTDTMAYSASALSFMLEDLAKPVIFTGAQLPIGALRTDGKENLITSIVIAASANTVNRWFPKCVSILKVNFPGATGPPK